MNTSLRTWSTVAVISIFIADCTNSAHQKPMLVKDTNVYYPYSPVYSELETGKAKYSQIVLQIWRQLETGNLSSIENYFSDSLTLIFKDVIYNGRKKEILGQFQKRRSQYQYAQFYVDTWLPVHARETNEDLVLVWGKQDYTKTNKERDYLVIHEVWKFDATGKIREMDQYITHPH